MVITQEDFNKLPLGRATEVLNSKKTNSKLQKKIEWGTASGH